MNWLEDPSIKLKYQKAKYKVKIWESNFAKNNGRNPSKVDIKEADSPIREAYKTYYKLKSLALQESLMDITFSDGAGNPAPGVPLAATPSGVQDKCEPNPEEESRTIPGDIKGDTMASADRSLGPNEGDVAPTKPADDLKSVWGKHLNKVLDKLKPQPDTKLQRHSSASSLSQKLYAGSAFRKRNPRKSLSCVRPAQDLGQSATDGFPCTGSSVSENSQSQAGAEEPHLPFPDQTSSGDSPFSRSQTTKVLPNFLNNSETFKIVMNSTPKNNSTPVSAIHKVLNDSFNGKSLTPKRNIDKGWLERCSKFNGVDVAHPTPPLTMASRPTVPPTVDDNIDSNDVHKDEVTQRFTANESDEDLVYSSGDERETTGDNLEFKINFKRKFSFEDKKELISCDDQRTKFMRKCQSESSIRVARASVPSETIKSMDIEKLADDIIKKEKRVQKKGDKKAGKLTKQGILEKKMESGQANENFVKINLKKKIYVRGKKHLNYSKYKKNEWKKKKKSGGGTYDGPSKEMSTCFKCGDIGHWAGDCKNTGDKLLPEEEDVVEESQFPTLDEVETMCSEPIHANKRKSITHFESHGSLIVDASNPSQNDGGNFSSDQPISNVVEPLYTLNDDGTVKETPTEVYKALKVLGHESFRPGQEEAVMRILSGLSTLVTLSTGSGKSLCYQLPAYLLAKRSKCITLVISPLVSLMDDQVSGASNSLKVACLHTNQTPKQRLLVMEQAKSGELSVLLVSPEAVVAGEKSTGFGSILKELPAIAFACIDEAHCVSQWSHNFRPSYLMICRVLREKLGVKTVLGLTATATRATCDSIVEHLAIPDGDKGVIQDIPLPNNLILSVSKDEHRDSALISLLKGERFKDFNSIIIYCTRQAECERLAALIRTCLQDAKPKEPTKRKSSLSWNAEPYHAGLSASKRKQIQNAFMSGQLRIVVATVAFGMGINKQDIRAVLHYNMPRAFESYVQEIGRAGRDGLPAHCHLFLDHRNGDQSELRRHIYSDSVDRHTIRKLLQRVFVPCKCVQISKLLDGVDFTENFDEPVQDDQTNQKEYKPAKSDIRCPGHEVAFVMDETVQALDLPEENISTMLCYLELHPKKWIKVLSPVYTWCKIMSYKGAKALKAAARLSPPLAMAIALDQRRGISHDKSNIIEFPVVDVAAAIGWDSGTVKNHLKGLEWTKAEDRWLRTGLTVEFTVLGFRVRAPGNLSPSELDEALDSLFVRVNGQERTALLQLQMVFKTLTSVSYPSIASCKDSVDTGRSEVLKTKIREYFDQREITEEIDEQTSLPNEEQVAADVRNLVCSYRDQTFTGRSVARIFYGISSPCFPAMVWGKCRFWRGHLHSNFKLLCAVATREILRMR